MSQRLLTMAAAVSMLMGAVWYLGSKEDGTSAEDSKVEQAGATAASIERAPHVPRQVAPTSTSRRTDLATEWSSGYRWNPGDPGIAASEEDAKWLDQHGYPSPDVEMRLHRLPLPSLRDLADSGNHAAQSILAFRSARGGAPQAEVLALLTESAKAGSVYALKTAGDIHFIVDGYKDPALANAYYMLQARAGDQAGFVQGMITDNLLDPDQRFRARVLEQAPWKGLQLSSLGDSPVRPGYQDFLDNGLSADYQGGME